MSNSSSTPNIPEFKDVEKLIREDQLYELMAIRYHLLVVTKRLLGIPISMEDIVLSMHMKLRRNSNGELEID
jgi:hypothetical protein